MNRVAVLIESQMAARRMLRFALELQEYRVVEAESHEEALAAAAGSAPELLVVGLNAGDADRQALVSRLRGGGGDTLPILLVGEQRLRDGWDLRLTGRCVWLDKPFRIGEVQERIDSLLDRRPAAVPARRKVAAKAESASTHPVPADAGSALPAMAGYLAEADRLTEQAFLRLGRQIEDGYRQALELAGLAARALQSGEGAGDGQMAARLQQRTAELAGNFAELVAALQFQDITRQRMQHVGEALEGLLSGGVAATAALGGICRLQHEQLQLAGADFLLALERIDDQLEGMAAGIDGLVDDGLAAGGADIGRQAGALGAALRTARAEVAIRQPFLARVEPVLAGLLALAGERSDAPRPAGDCGMFDDLRKRYTMRSERVVHQRFLQQQAPRSAGEVADAPAGSLGDNVELF